MIFLTHGRMRQVAAAGSRSHSLGFVCSLLSAAMNHTRSRPAGSTLAQQNQVKRIFFKKSDGGGARPLPRPRPQHATHSAGDSHLGLLLHQNHGRDPRRRRRRRPPSLPCFLVLLSCRYPLPSLRAATFPEERRDGDHSGIMVGSSSLSVRQEGGLQ